MKAVKKQDLVECTRNLLKRLKVCESEIDFKSSAQSFVEDLSLCSDAGLAIQIHGISSNKDNFRLLCGVCIAILDGKSDLYLTGKEDLRE